MTIAALEPVESLRGLSAYHVPRASAPIDLVLSGNEGPAPDAALYDVLKDPELARRYPSAAPLEAFLAAGLGVAPEQVLVTAGADEALDRAFRAYVARDQEVILPSPTFVMFAHYAKLAGALIKTPAWPAEAFPERAVLASISDYTRAVALVSPNNPTGAVIPAGVIATIAKAAPHALMLVDFAYVECADADPTRELLAYDNVLVFRTLSKVWGLAGLRVGYVVGPAKLIRPLRAAGGPYSVASTSLALAHAHLQTGAGRMREYVAVVRKERDALFAALFAAGARPVRSQANFVFARWPSAEIATHFWERLAQRGIGVRGFPGDANIGDGLRITCPGDAAGQARLLEAIAAISAVASEVA